MMVPKQFERAADIQIAPIANWGRYYPKREVEVSVVNVMRNIIVDYWKYLGEYQEIIMVRLSYDFQMNITKSMQSILSITTIQKSET